MSRTRKYQTNSERQAAYRQRCAQAADTELITHASGPTPSLPGRRRWKAMLKAASVLLESAATEMQDHFDQHCQAWQDSQPGESLLEMLESAQEALSILEDITGQSRQGKPRIT